MPGDASFLIEESDSDSDPAETPATQVTKKQKIAASSASGTPGRSTPGESPVNSDGKRTTPTKTDRKASKTKKAAKGDVGGLGELDCSQGTPASKLSI